MSKLGETKLTVQSGTLAKRLKALTGLTGEAKKAAEAFSKADAKLQELAQREGATEAQRDALAEELVELDVARDTLVHELAIALVASKLGPRLSPFKPFTQHAPSALCKLTFASETKAVIDLCANITKAKPPAPVRALVKALLKENARVSALLDKLDGPTTAHDEAMFARNRFMSEWYKSLSNLRVQLKAALVGRPGAYQALFARE